MDTTDMRTLIARMQDMAADVPNASHLRAEAIVIVMQAMAEALGLAADPESGRPGFELDGYGAVTEDIGDRARILAQNRAFDISEENADAAEFLTLDARRAPIELTEHAHEVYAGEFGTDPSDLVWQRLACALCDETDDLLGIDR